MELLDADLKIGAAGKGQHFQKDFFYRLVVLLDRSDSSFWIDDTGRNSEFVATLGLTSEPLLDRVITKTDRLRIWRVSDRSSDGRLLSDLSGYELDLR